MPLRWGRYIAAARSPVRPPTPTSSATYLVVVAQEPIQEVQCIKQRKLLVFRGDETSPLLARVAAQVQEGAPHGGLCDLRSDRLGRPHLDRFVVDVWRVRAPGRSDNGNRSDARRRAARTSTGKAGGSLTNVTAPVPTRLL